jgi:hypothetical protein
VSYPPTGEQLTLFISSRVSTVHLISSTGLPLLNFEAADLDEISAVLMRWFGIRTQLDDPSLANKKFTGAIYKNKPLSSFLDNIKVISHINTYFDEKHVLHFSVTK